MSYIPTTTSTVYRTVTVTHTTTHTVTAMPTQSSADTTFNNLSIAVNILSLAGIVIGVGKFVHEHTIPSVEKIQHWRSLIQKWKAWMCSLPPDQMQHITQQHPDLMRQLDTDMSTLDYKLRLLEIKFHSATLIQRYNPASDVSRQYRSARDTMATMEEVWNTSTERYRNQQSFRDRMPIDYPSGITPPPPNFMQRRKEQYERLRASINRERLNDFHVKAMELIESMKAYVW